MVDGEMVRCWDFHNGNILFFSDFTHHQFTQFQSEAEQTRQLLTL